MEGLARVHHRRLAAHDRQQRGSGRGVADCGPRKGDVEGSEARARRDYQAEDHSLRSGRRLLWWIRLYGKSKPLTGREILDAGRLGAIDPENPQRRENLPNRL
jgi:hypothetical protein